MPPLIPLDELEFKATRAGGPGGQHVNVTSTRVEVRWNPERSRTLSDEQKARIAARLASRLDGEGWLRVAASDTRSQRQNRDLAVTRLEDLVARALVVPKKRKKTRPSAASREERLRSKKRQSEKKHHRRKGDWRD
ncbi:MAG TPA: alternative ribosome rescue aminoacyl-tRNA hydrolase ArfB [Gemmatimonadaceae bacterium]|nr:alternative ribosome rescue aminoacyl-tRNA hydrolase ArfB [Gemmatimonadaceae bacterium]